MVPAALFPPATPFTSQVTAVFDAPVTVAVNCWLPPAGTLADAGEIDTAIALLEDGLEGGGAEGAAEPPPHPAANRQSSATMNPRSLE